MDFVGEYTSKTKEAQRKAKMAEALQKMALTPQSGTIDSGGYSAVMPDGTVMNTPGQQQVNYGGVLSGLGAAFLGNKAEENAATAETEAQNARMEALKGMIGSGGATLTPEQVIQLDGLGLDANTMKLMMPKETPFGALSQGTNTKAGIALAESLGKITPETASQMRAALDAQENADKEKYVFEQHNKTFAPDRPRGMTMAEWARTDPEGFAAMKRAEAEAARLGKPPVLSPYDTQFQKDQAKIDAKVLEGSGKIDSAIETAKQYSQRQKDKPYDGTKFRLADDAAKTVGLDILPSSYNTEVQQQLQDANQFHLNAMEQMRGFGQVTESEQAIISKTQFDIYDSAEARQKKVDTILQQLEIGKAKVEAAKSRVGARSAYGSQMAPSTGGWSIEEE